MRFGPVWLMQPIPYFGEKIRGDWIYEPKIDGWRMQIIRYKDGHLEAWGRRLERKPNWSRRLSYLLTGLENIIPTQTLLDCELYSDGGRRFIPSLFARKPKAKPMVYVFDVVFFDGANISKKTLRKRKNLLEKIQFKRPFFCVTGKNLANIKRNYVSEVKKGHEGIVIKKLDSPYLIGKEAPIATHYWRKIK
jgi:ATP-dependent DNA ligase